jgi:hypothetical protein
MFDKIIHDLQNNMFNVFVFISYLTYAGLAFGLFKNAPAYLDDLDYYVKIYISLFLLWRFNAFRVIKFSELDRKIAFSAGVLLFTTSAVNQLLKSYLDDIQLELAPIL